LAAPGRKRKERGRLNYIIAKSYVAKVKFG